MTRSLAKDHDEKRQSIMDTAAGFFAEKGYDRASMNDLAQACGVSKALIYHYHAGKEALLFDILHNHFNRILMAISAIDDGLSSDQLSPDRVLRRRVDALLTSYRGADDEHRLQLSAMDALPDNQRAQLTNMQRQIVKYFADDITRINPAFAGKQDRLLTPVTMSLFGMLNWFYMWYQPPQENEGENNGKDNVGITRAEYADLATNILLGGIAGIK